MPARIFISYRRADTEGFAHAIYTLLEHEFGAANLFMDVDAIPPGQDFVAVLEDAVDRCDLLLALIGPKWLEAATDGGRRRLDDPQDFVRVEIATALKRGIIIIPVLVQGAAMPAEASLPADLKPLARRQAFSLGQHLTPDVRRLAAVMKKGLRARPARNTAGVLSGAPAGRDIRWGSWFLFFLAAASISFVGLSLIDSYAGNLRTTQIGSLGFTMIMTVLVALLQWLIFLRRRYQDAWGWLLINAAFGLLGGISVNWLILSIGDLVTALFLFAWLLFGGVFGLSIANAAFRRKD